MATAGVDPALSTGFGYGIVLGLGQVTCTPLLFDQSD